jgi:glutathione synthase
MALVRIPGPGDHRGNLAVGARAEVRPLTDRDLWICDQIAPELRNRGLLFAGIDVIGDFMTEVNVTSPTGIRELERMSDVRIADQILDAVASRLR